MHIYKIIHLDIIAFSIHENGDTYNSNLRGLIMVSMIMRIPEILYSTIP